MSETSELLDRGFLYPRTGLVWHAHHNIAWQITRDRRFVSSWGSLDDLADEAAQFEGDVILSSEFFEAVIDHPERFAPLRFHPAFRDHDFTVVLYVRNQGAYAESLYSDLLKHGLREEFMAFLKPVLRDRKFEVREWVFHFDYTRIYSQWAACEWANLVVRNYHHLAGDSTVVDFCSVVCPDLLEKAADFTSRENPREQLNTSLARFYSNRLARGLEPNEERAIEEICAAVNRRRVTMADDLRRTVGEAFIESNKAFCSAAGLPKTGLEDMGNTPAGAIPIDSIFSFELLNLVASGRSDAATIIEKAVALYSQPGDSRVFGDSLSEESCPALESSPNSVTDSIKILAPQKKSPLWQDATYHGDGWEGLDWFGLFNTNSSPWIYHWTLGWLCALGTSTEDIWFWDPQWDAGGGWWWTSASSYPWIYSSSDGAWFYYEEKASTPGERWFCNFGTEWATLGPSWFGLFGINGSPWIFHPTLGWLCPLGTSTDSIWFWDPQWNGLGGWWRTNASSYPWIYSSSEEAWFYYDEKASTPGERWFCNSGAGWATH